MFPLLLQVAVVQTIQALIHLTARSNKVTTNPLEEREGERERERKKERERERDRKMDGWMG